MNPAITSRHSLKGAAVLRGMWLAAGRFLVLGVVAGLAAMSCRGADAPVKPAGVDYYTCAMHPSVKLQRPGQCPICGMELLTVMDKPGATNSMPMADSAPGEFTVPLNRQQQIGVTYATVAKCPFCQCIRAAGRIAYDKQRHWELVAHTMGYIQQLQISSRGDWVEKNQPLMVIDCPDLLVAQEQLLDWLRLRDVPKSPRPAAPAGGTQTHGHGVDVTGHPHQEPSPSSFIEGYADSLESARRQLILQGLTGNQLAELEQSRVARNSFTLFSPHQGVVQDLPVEQGQMVSVGERLVDIVDLSMVWVWADFYEDELPMLKKNLPVTITSPAYPGEKFEGKVSVVDPFMNDAMRTGRVRIDVENPGLKLRPDMFVNAELTVNMGEGLAVPAGAVLQTGQHDIVFVARGEGRLEPRYIELGRKYGDSYEVKGGLKAGERVVTSANFLIDAEAKVQGALKSW